MFKHTYSIYVTISDVGDIIWFLTKFTQQNGGKVNWACQVYILPQPKPWVEEEG